MSVWPQKTAASLLSGSNGVLVSVSIHVDPRHLESLLEALAQVSFPINPQIYHDASMVYRYADGREVTEATTLVEFPACRPDGRGGTCTRGVRIRSSGHACHGHAGGDTRGSSGGVRAGAGSERRGVRHTPSREVCIGSAIVRLGP